jgi:phosphoribosylformylglycinamidine synthase
MWKDSVNKTDGYCVTSPMSLIISAFAPVSDACATLTPVLSDNKIDTELLFIDLSDGHSRLGGSALEQVYNKIGGDPADVNNPLLIKAFFEVMQYLNNLGIILAYHDRSDGGLFITICEMVFASHTGVTIFIDDLAQNSVEALFNEELGAIIQIRKSDITVVRKTFENAGLGSVLNSIGNLRDDDRVVFMQNGKEILSEDRIYWQRIWSETSYRIQSLRDNPDCAKQEFDQILDTRNSGLYADLTFDINARPSVSFINTGVRPQLAILREQGINGHVEMAAAFNMAGFECIDVHMTDILSGRVNLIGFKGLVACGGFSFGDVLGAGEGWAKSILFNKRARDEFSKFLDRTDTFVLGVCNGCQMLSSLRELITGASHWPRFVRNLSEQFEARLSMVRIENSPSILLRGMDGSCLPIVVAHGEGRAELNSNEDMISINKNSLISLRFVDNLGNPTEVYPSNPNGSPYGIAGLCTPDGRVTIMMPHPERVFLTIQNSWHPSDWPKISPWLRLFDNARSWVG